MAEKFRTIKLKSGTEIFLGKDAENNDELVRKFEGKGNVILHTSKPGSPFVVILKNKPDKKEIKEAAIYCAMKSQDWRDNKSDVVVNVFTGKDVAKPSSAKTGTWKVAKSEKIKVKKRKIEVLENAKDK